MKRIIAFTLALAVAFCFAGCGEEAPEYSEIKELTLYFYTGDPGYRRITVSLTDGTMTVTDYDEDVVDENLYEIETEELLAFVETEVLPALSEGAARDTSEESKVLWSVQVETDVGHYHVRGLGEDAPYPEYWDDLMTYLSE